MKKYLFLLFAIILFLTGNLMAQKTVSNSYVFTTGTSTYGGDLGFTYTTVIGPNQDNASSGLITLPFTFNYLGQSFTQMSVTSNGLISLGSTPLTGNETANDMAASIPGYKIAPYWDDLSTGTNGYVKHAYYSGTLYINFRLTVPKNATGATNADIQVRLTASGGISFYYGSTVPLFQSIPANSGGYSIGIGNSSTDFASVTMTGPTTATCAFGTANNTNTQAITGPFDIYFNPDATLPTISAPTVLTILGNSNRTFTKTIADAGKGIPTSGDYVPRVYYKKNEGGAYVSTPGVLTSGNSASGTWTFTVDHALVGGVDQGDVIYYYVAAQDQAYNIASYPAGVVATNVNTITAPPASPASYIIPMDFSGTITVGSGGDYPSLTNSGGLFEQLNAGNVVGNVIVSIISDLTSETGSIPLAAWTDGTGGPFTVTINPSGARTVSGSSSTTGLIYLNGAKNLIIDGLNTGGNSLTIANTSTLNTAINFVNGANNNIVRNATIKANGGSVITFGTTSTNVNFNNVIRNNTITSGTTVPSNGISFNGSTSYDSYDNVVDNNKIINFSVSGITLGNGYINTTVSNNEIYNAIPSGTSLNGITLGTYYGAGIYNVFNNYIHDLNPASSSSTGTVNGIYYGQSSYNTPNDVLNIYNNVISLDATSSNTNITLNGMWLGGGNSSYTPLVYIYYNSIYLGGTGIVAGTSTGLKIGGGNYYSKHTIKNNAIYNARSGGSGKHYAVGYYYGTNLISNNNDIYVSGTNGVLGRYVATDYATLAAWQAASSQDAQSFSGNPAFTSPTDLMPDAANPSSNNLDAKAVVIPTITTDINGNTRDASTPDIGAYEFTGSPVSYTIAGNAGLAGVTLNYTDGSPKSVQSEANGAYSFTVSYSWSGTVTPSKTGYTFTPASRSFANVIADQTDQDFTPVPILYTISGNTGKAGTVLTYTDGEEKSVMADDQGFYTFTVSYNWSGTVTPLWAGFTYTPLSYTYENVLADKPNQDYTVAPTVFTISGNAGVVGTILTYTDGVAKNVVAGPGGDYSITVSYNWSGTVTPALSGYTFQPSTRTYTNVLASMPAQDFTAGASSYLIVGNTGVGEVVLSYTVNNENLTVTSTPIGNYIINVPFQWSGTVTPSKIYYTFDPISLTYSDVAANQMGQNYAATCVNPTEGGTISASILSGCEPFDPSLITGTEVTGPVEYKWQNAVAPFETWTDIESNTPDYNPGAITQTTQYKRLVRATCMTNWTGAAESNVVTMTVNGLPQLEMTMNAITVTANNDGIEETGSFDVCNSATNNLSLSAMADLKSVSGSIKVTTEVVTTTNVTSTFSNATALLSDYTIPTTQSGSLIDPELPGTLALRFQLFNDLNDNNSLDAAECAGDWVVYTITVNPILTAAVTVTASANTVCEGTEVTFTAAPVNGGNDPTYEWFVKGVSVATGSTYSYAPADGDIITVQMTSDATPCLAASLATSNEVMMVVHPIVTPTVSIVADANPACAGSSVIFTATATNGGTDPVYVWKVNTVIVGSNANTYSYSPATGDVVTCEMTPDASVTCPGISPAISNEVTMVVNSTVASVSIVSDVNTVCQGTQVNFTATPTNSGDAPIYQWKVNGVEAGSNSATFSYVPDNGDIVTCEMTSNAPCVSAIPVVSNSVEVTVNPILTASVTIAASVNNVCEGTEVTFTPTPVNGGNAPAYQWYVGNDPVGSGSTYTYAPAQGDLVSVVMTSNSTDCLASMTATSDPVTMTVYTRPVLQATINGATVTNNNDGTDDTQSLNVCNGKSKNLFYEFAEITGIAPASVKVIEQYTLSNVMVGLSNRTFTLSAPLVGSTNVRLSNNALPGSLVMRYRVFIDGNNNNLLDASECAGDWIVYTLTIDPALKAPGAITGSVNFTPNSTRTYSVMPVENATGYIWSYSGKGATITPPNPAGNTVSITFAATATAGTLSVKAVNNCGESPVSSLKLRLTKSGQIAVDPLTASEEVIPLMVYPVRNVEIRVEGTVNSGAMATLYDMLGRVVLTKELEKGNLNILSLQGLKTAVYVLSINDNGNIQTFKVPLRE